VPAALGGLTGSFCAWRLDKTVYAPTWDQGIGAKTVGGRWSPKGQAVIYSSLDPATTILEVAVHAGFHALDTVAHTLIEFEVTDPSMVHVVEPAAIPNPNWLRPGSISAGQQDYGRALIEAHPFVLVPSVISSNSWNLLVNPVTAAGMFRERRQEAFGLDGRLNPAR
jgi:RES domain-containing protein